MSSAIRLRSTTDPLKAPSIRSDPASTVRRARSSERAFASARVFPQKLNYPRSVPFLFQARLNSPQLARSLSSPSSLHARARVPPPFSQSPAPSQLPPSLPEHAGNIQKEGFFRQISDARTAAVFFFFPRRVKSTAAEPFVRGRGAGAACFPSSKARPLATVCRGRTRWLLRWLL